MANVRLLRQSLYDHNKKVAAINSDYMARYNEYRDKTLAWNALVEQYPYMPHVIAPTTPQMGEVPKSPSLTQNDYEAMRYRTQDPAGMAMETAKGLVGKSDVEALNDQGSKFTAQQNPFADPNDPQNLRERGVLARTLGGQLG